jgi:hypothetical protein
MARTKKASQKARDIATSLAATHSSRVDSPQPEPQLEPQTEPQTEPQAESQANTRAPPYVWLEPAEVFLIDELKEAIRRGERVKNGFHPRLWDRIVTRFLGEGLDRVTRTQLKSKHDSWKAKWKLFDQLANQSGWNVNEAGDTLYADDEAWDRAIVKWGSPVRQFRGKAFKYRQELTEIFDGTAATGLYARVTASQRAELEDEMNDDASRDPDEVPCAAGDVGFSPVWPALDDSQFIGLDTSTTVTTLASTPVPETPLSNALKRKQRATDSAGRRVRQRGDDSFIRRLADAVIESEYNIPGGNAKEEAVAVFQRDYEDVLEAAQFYVILDRFNDPQNVITFNALMPGKRRDGWIRHLGGL